MRNLIFVAVLLLAFGTMAVAQDVPQFEVFGGWNIVLPEEQVDLDYLNGWEGTFVVNANEYAGVAVDASGQYSGEEGAPSFHSILIGPQVSIPKHERIVPFVRALFGVTHVNFENDIMNENGFTMAYGGGVDVKINDRFSVRPIQAEYMTTRIDGEFINFARLAAGVVINFGER